jgi:signal transduction histidine kinase
MRRVGGAGEEALVPDDEILGAVAHDLRNQIVAIQMMADRLAANDPDSPQLIEGIRRSAGQMQVILKNLLDARRIVSGSLELALAPLDLVELLHAVIGDRDIELECVGELPVIRGDRDRLLRAFGELISHAIDHAGPGARITLFASAAVDGIRVQISLPAGELEHDGSAPGLTRGLGLAISRALIEAHRGEFRHESVERGTTLSVVLPVD